MDSSSPRESFLLVSPHRPVVDLLLQILSEGKCPVQSAPGLTAALEIARREEIILAIVDMSLPDGEGLRTIQELDLLGKNIAMLGLTAEDDAETAYLAVRNGAYDFLTVPIDRQKVSIRIRVALERRAQRISENLYKLALEERVNLRTQEVWDNREKIRNAFLNTIAALERALQAKHGYTEGHSKRVAALSVRLAKAMTLPRDEVRNIELGALFHDIGKIGIHDQILNKPGRLSDDEYEEMKLHPLIAEQILAPIAELRDIMHIIKHEHERFDGKGYPSRISGDAIPLGARIVAVADAYDAIVTDRAYHHGEARERAVEEITRCSGTQFDPKVVEAFLRVMHMDREAEQPSSQDTESPSSTPTTSSHAHPA